MVTSDNSRNLWIRYIIAAVLAASLTMLPGCRESSAAEAKVIEDLENMRYIELDEGTDAEIESLLSDQGKEYYEMFLGKAGEFDYKIIESAEEEGAVTVHVEITTYDFASEYLKSWTEFLEASDADKEDGKGYDTAGLYETMFRNLSNIREKDLTSDVYIKCVQDEDGSWKTDAGTNPALRNAILGGMIDEISSLARLGE